MSFLDHECGFGTLGFVNPNLGGTEPEAEGGALWVSFLDPQCGFGGRAL